MTDPRLSDLLTVDQAATRLGVTGRRVRQLIIRGQLRARKLGRQHVIELGDLISYQATRRPAGWPKGKPRKAVQL